MRSTGEFFPVLNNVDCTRFQFRYCESKELLLERAKQLNLDKTIHPEKVWRGVRGRRILGPYSKMGYGMVSTLLFSQTIL